MEIECDGCLRFLDTLITQIVDGSPGHSVYRKPTHIGLYLNKNRHYHPAQKQAGLSTSVYRARAISDGPSVQGELVFLRTTFQHNGLGVYEISHFI